MKLAAAAILTLVPSICMAQEVPAIQASSAAQVSVAPVSSAQAATSFPSPTGGLPQPNQETQEAASNSVPKTMPPPVKLLSPDKPLTAKQAHAVRTAGRWMGRVSAPTMREDGRMHFNFASGEPFIVCAPLHVCDIALQPGEVVNLPIQNGDPRWIIHPGISGSGMSRTTHLIVKPTDSGLNSNIVVETNKRTYSLRLISRENQYMPLVAFDYPEDTTNAWNVYATTVGGSYGGYNMTSGSVCDQSPSIPPSAFRISGDNPGWRPVQAYSVSTANGVKTCIEFPSSIGSQDLPSLLLLGNDGGWFSGPSEQFVNYRFVSRRIELDRLIDRAVLVSGVGRSQQRVEIARREYR